MPNRLAGEDSPYLLQHKDDPVDWHAWGDEAFATAKALDRPVFLSVGYSACHWCHVMAHESFQDSEVADALNRYFVSIKVDREERPDVDDAYMTAVQLATGHGGWPMSVFLTPDKRPFFAGTYFPKDARGDFPGFRTLVTSLGQSWIEQRGDIEEAATKFAATLRSYLAQSAGPLSPSLDVRLVDKAVEELHGEFDFENGGFGSRPKFPPHATLRFLMEYGASRHLLPDFDESLIEQAAHMALMTLEKMALGGIHDHVGGGFHRYSTDAEWRLPHFEKMLTDNALLLSLYSSGAASAGDSCVRAHFERVANGIVRWMSSTVRTADGLFMSAVDADSEGEEGLYYTWTFNDVVGAVGETFAQAFGVELEGNFHDEATGRVTGRNVLKLDQDVEGSFDSDLAALSALRADRVRPLTDQKCVASHNALAVSALAQSGDTELASACAESWVSAFEALGHVPHQITNGNKKGLGFLDDYAFMANAMLDMHDATGEHRWRQTAEAVIGQMCGLFQDGDRFTATSERHEELFGRTVPALDHATPSPLAAAARSLGRLGRTDESRRVLLGSLGWMQRTSRAAHSLVQLALEDLIAHPGADRTVGKATKADVSVSLEPREAVVDEDGWAQTEVVIRIPEGLHINSNDPTAKWLTPTALHVEGVLGEASFPAAGGERYEGEVRIPLRLRAKAKTDEFVLRVRYQACTDSECQLPQEATLTGVVVVP